MRLPPAKSVQIFHPSASFTATTIGRHKHQIGRAHIITTRKMGKMSHSLSKPTLFTKRLRSKLKRAAAARRQTNHKAMRLRTLTTLGLADTATLHPVIWNESITFPREMSAKKCTRV